KTANRQPPLPTSQAAYTSATDVSTQKQVLLDRANRSNHAVTAIYNSLMSRVPTTRQEQLKEQQEEWLKMRRTEDADEDLRAEGLNADPNVVRRFAEMEEARVVVLKATLRTR